MRARAQKQECNLEWPNVHFEGSKLKVLHEKDNHGRAEVLLGMWPTILHLLSPKQHSMIRVMHTPHICTKRKPLTKAGRLNILVHVEATFDTFQDVLGFLCRHVLRCLLHIHARIDVLAVNNETIRGYTDNLIITRTLVIKRIIFYRNYL